MKTIYLKAKNLKDLFADVAKVIDNYNGEIESEQDGVYCHYIGYIEKIPATLKEDLTIDVPATIIKMYHANLLVPNDFDETIFKTKITTPNTPSHEYAL